MTPDADRLYRVNDETWPAARVFRVGPWNIRQGQGGGKRVSAATLAGPVSANDIPAAEVAMREIGQRPLFMVRQQDRDLDELLNARGYGVVDPVTMYTLPVERLTDTPLPRVTAFTLWEPLAIMVEIWNNSGIGPERLAVMDRAKVKTGVFARWNEKPAGVAFAAVHDGVCMVHAVEVLAHQRRLGVAQWIMRGAAFWARDHGASHLSVLCVTDNDAANGLYRALGFVEAGRYHYRQSPEPRSQQDGR